MNRKRCLWMAVVAACGAACASSSLAAEPPIPVLIVDGQNNHDWKATTPVLREALESSGRFAVAVATSPPNGASMDGFRPSFASSRAVLLNYNGASWPAATRAAFVEYVRGGGGVVVVHAADNAFPDWPEYNAMIGLGGWGGRNERAGPYLVLDGGEWKRDPSPGIGGAHGPQYAFGVRVRDPDHPIMRGMPAEWLHVQDELYSHLRGPAQNVTVLATAYSARGQRGSGRHEPVIFTVEFGKGRIFHTALGHADYSMRCVGFITSLARGTEWAATGRVTLPIPDDFPTVERTRGRGDTSVSSRVRPPLPAWPELPSPPPPAKDPHDGDRAGVEREFTGIRFCWCPEGSFQMGSQVQEELFQGDEQTRSVTFPRGFWLAKHELTRGRWREIMGTTPWAGDATPTIVAAESDDWPATHVDWNAAADCCRKLTDRERQAGRLPAGWEYRLPTEAEWEYGCRAGSQGRFGFGDREADLAEHGWFAANTTDEGKSHPQPVGRKRPNAWGLCDMHGNVWEWCSDTYEGMKAFRGGCWANIAWWCRSADRGALPAGNSNDMLGFRIVLAHAPASGEPEYRPTSGTWRLPLETPYLTGSNAVEVLLPSDYDRDPHRRHRVLYVLPVAGEGGEHGNSLEVIRSLGLHDRHGLICVAPLFDRWAMPWYGNHATDPRMRYEDHMIKVVLPAIESRYRTLPGRAGRLLVGFSKSGWGAVCLLLGHGDTFEAAASFDAPLMFTGRQFGAWLTDKTYGTPEQMDADCPTALLRKHAANFRDRPRLVIAGKKVFGTLNDRKAAHPYEGPSHTEAFHELTDSLGVKHAYAMNGHDSKLLPGFPEHSWNATWMKPVVDLLVRTVVEGEAETQAGTADTTAALSADIVVVGATPGGIAAAVAAARGGSRVVLFEEQAHVGGVIAGGLSNIDNVRKEAIGGLFNEFKRRVVEHYVKAYGPDSLQVKDCRGGTDFEPRVAEQVFGEMLAGEKRITVLLRHRLRAANKRGPRLTDIVAVPLAGGEPVTLAGRVFIDATYEGDLAAVAGVACRIGRESRGEYGEPLAGRIYMDMVTKEVLPGSTGEGDRGIQAFTYRFPLTNDPGNRVPVEKPEGYDAADYRDLLADVEAGHVKRLRDVIQMRRAPNRKVVVNNDHMEHGHPRQSLDLAEENWDWPEGTPETRDRIRRRYWTYVEGMLWFLKHDSRVPEAVRQEAAEWGFCKDEFPDHRHRPWQIYVREARRIVGEANFTARDTEPEPATGRPRAVPDAIAMVEYGFDSHAVHKFDPAHPSAREGYLGMGHPPTQLPYGVVVPKDVDGLLVPVACSASRLGYQTIRMEPVFMALGEACGIAATTAMASGVKVRAVDVARVQKEIVARGGVIALEDPGKPGEPKQPAAKPARSARPRNIVFILADDHRHDLLGCAGHPFVETPGLDSLARDGVRFRNAFVTTSLCSPSRASILTGQYAHTHGVIDNTAVLHPGTVLFPELLKRAGYRTGFFGKWHIGETTDAPQPGFDRWVSFRGHGSYLPGSSRPDRPPAMLNIDGREVPQKGYITDELTDYCLDWLTAAAKDDKPFFAYLSHKGIHGNFQPAARHVGRYRDKPLPRLVAHPEKPDAASRKPLWVRNQRNSWHGVEFPFQDTVPLADLYRSQCEALLSVDESVARVREWLAEHALADSTMVVYMGDNGFLWGEHGLVDKRTAYEESMRVPLLGVCPGTWPAGTVRDEMVAGIDIAPTFLAAAGIAPPATMAGRSFLDLAAGRAVEPPWRDRLLYEYFWEYTYPQTPTVLALRTVKHKFIQCHGVWDLDELYDLEADPREQRNLVLDPAHAATVESMRRELNTLLAESGVTSVPFSPKRSHGNSLRLESGSGAADFPPEWIRNVPAASARTR